MIYPCKQTTHKQIILLPGPVLTGLDPGLTIPLVLGKEVTNYCQIWSFNYRIAGNFWRDKNFKVFEDFDVSSKIKTSKFGFKIIFIGERAYTSKIYS